MTGSYDPALNLTYWGVGNPGPDWNPDQRPGDNLYTDSVVALDADTGAAEVALPVHAERRLRLRLGAGAGARRHRLAAARRRRRCCGRTATASSTCSIATTGKFLLGKPFVKVNWASGLDANGPADPDAAAAGQPTWPGNQGGTNWYSPSFSPRTGLFYFSAWEDYASIFRKETGQYVPGPQLQRAAAPTVLTPVPGAPGVGIGRRGPINNWTDAVGHGAVIAIDPQTGAARSGSSDAVRRHRRRHPDDRQPTCCSPAAAKAISTRSTRAPARCCGRRASAARS